MTMQKKHWEDLEAPDFEEHCNCKDYSKWEDLKLKDDTFNLVQWVSIIYRLKIYLFHEKVKWWMGWCNFFAKSKT
jgi:hypothetical protein